MPKTDKNIVSSGEALYITPLFPYTLFLYTQAYTKFYKCMFVDFLFFNT